MQHEDGPAGRDTDHQRHSNRQPPQLGIDRSIRLGTAVPPTVLLAHMCDERLFLQGWRDGPSAYLSPSDELSLRRKLVAAFGSNESALRRDQGDAL